MNQLASLGLILLLALLSGHLVKFLRIPEVTGYILAGIAVGPSVLGWVSHENLVALSVFSEVALGLILFSIGSVFDLTRFREIGRRIFFLTLVESSLAAALVIATMVASGQPWQIALLLGAIAIETAVASTLMVLRELDSEGPLTETLMGIMAVNNILCLVAFSLAAAVLDLSPSLTSPGSALNMFYGSMFQLVWTLAGSAALGYLCGLMLASWASRVVEHGETLILLAGTVLLCVGVANLLDLSPMLASLAVGATMVNLSERGRELFKALARTDPPLYAIFFVIAGADLDMSLLGKIGALGALYVFSRAGGKFLGARLGARWLGLQPSIQRLLGFGLMTQAGLAIGLTLVVNRRFPEFASTVATIVLSSIVIYEMIGPISTRFALVRSGEAAARRQQRDLVMD